MIKTIATMIALVIVGTSANALSIPQPLNYGDFACANSNDMYVVSINEDRTILKSASDTFNEVIPSNLYNDWNNGSDNEWSHLVRTSINHSRQELITNVAIYNNWKNIQVSLVHYIEDNTALVTISRNHKVVVEEELICY